MRGRVERLRAKYVGLRKQVRAVERELEKALGAIAKLDAERTKRCGECGERIALGAGERNTRRFCSATCRIRAHRKRTTLGGSP